MALDLLPQLITRHLAESHFDRQIGTFTARRLGGPCETRPERDDPAGMDEGTAEPQ